MAIPKFYLEPRPSADGKQNINLFYSFSGQRLQYYTGIRVEIKDFRAECNSSGTIKPIRTIAKFAAQNNKLLSEMADAAVTIVKEAKGENRNVKFVRDRLDLIYKPQIAEPKIEQKVVHNFISYFEQLILNSKSGKRLISVGKNAGNRYTHNTIKNYGITLSALKRYMAYNNVYSLPFEAINKEFYQSFRHYCYEVEQKEKSTFGSYIKDIKMVMAESETIGFKTKDFIMPSYEADTLYLTLDQIEKIASLDLTDGKRTIEHQRGKVIEQISYSTLDKVRDLSLVGFYSGLRFSDFSSLQPKSIDGNFIKIKQIKTGGRITIPIMSRLHPILNKYPNGLPTISNQKFNDYIKEVGKLAGLTEERKVNNTKGNTKNSEISPLYSLITSHCCRRSYATNMFKAGVPPMLIMSATGHKTETSFLKYIRANNDDKAKLLADTLQKLGL